MGNGLILVITALVVVGSSWLSELPAEAHWSPDNLANHLFDSRSDGKFGIDDAQTMLHNRLTTGLSSGRLTVHEYNLLLSQHKDLAELKAKYAQGGLSDTERVALLQRLLDFNRQLDQSYYNGRIAGLNRPLY